MCKCDPTKRTPWCGKPGWEMPKPTAIDRARVLTKPFGADDGLETWTAGLLTDADNFQNRKRPDPLGGFIKR